MTLGGYGANCCIGAFVERGASSLVGPTTDTYMISLCNTIGVTLESKYIPFQPTHICVTQSYAIIAGKSLFYIWGISGFASNQIIKKPPFEK